MIETDFDREIMLEDFGTIITLLDGNKITGIFDNAYQSFGDGIELSGVSPAILCQTKEVEHLKNGDKIKLNCLDYIIRDDEQDGTGLTRLILKR